MVENSTPEEGRTSKDPNLGGPFVSTSTLTIIFRQLKLTVYEAAGDKALAAITKLTVLLSDGKTFICIGVRAEIAYDSALRDTSHVAVHAVVESIEPEKYIFENGFCGFDTADIDIDGAAASTNVKITLPSADLLSSDIVKVTFIVVLIAVELIAFKVLKLASESKGVSTTGQIALYVGVNWMQDQV